MAAQALASLPYVFTEYITYFSQSAPCAYLTLRFARMNLQPASHSPIMSHSLAQSVARSPISNGQMRRRLTSSMTKQIGNIMKVPDPQESDIVIPYVYYGYSFEVVAYFLLELWAQPESGKAA